MEAVRNSASYQLTVAVDARTISALILATEAVERHSRAVDEVLELRRKVFNEEYERL